MTMADESAGDDKARHDSHENEWQDIDIHGNDGQRQSRTNHEQSTKAER